MASGLRAKLNMMRSSAPVEATPRRGGLICHVSREPLDPAIFNLPATGLRRIGWCGPRFDIRRCLFLDTETTGLSGGAGTVAFLVGVGYVEGESLVIEQLMLREYADEPALLDRLGQRMADFDSVCTFNGRNFDMPLLETRFTMNRMRDRWRALENLDLLYPSRRAWKLRLGSCRLCNLEAEILGMPREDDLPGSEVPARFFQFMKTGEDALLDDIVQHNRQDIATLAKLLVRLCAINDRPDLLSDQRDQFSMGKSLERLGELRPAREMYRASARPRPVGTLAALSGERIAGSANWRLYGLCRRSGDWDGAEAVLKQMLRRRQLPGAVCTELSKLYEHRRKDYPKALEFALKSAGYPDGETADLLEKRTARIRRKMTRQTEAD
ncbi:MAG: ribonuclease H-like domain-containing protein [Clostridia bacterium]|nr:ribonuclease H-like domain-containing protein [Clostridia bacterium]MBQ6121054.1 ribonuclease H-like domain-containing protein [Clostridia bacterium]MBQ6326005.1 ribonuclease H-like domain-containing protein [Clostridia bacterium]